MLLEGGAAGPPDSSFHAQVTRTRLTAALIASQTAATSAHSLTIAGENPWLLSQVHYIMPASVCIPPPFNALRLCALSFSILPQSLAMSNPHDSSTPQPRGEAKG